MKKSKVPTVWWSEKLRVKSVASFSCVRETLGVYCISEKRKKNAGVTRIGVKFTAKKGKTGIFWWIWGKDSGRIVRCWVCWVGFFWCGEKRYLVVDDGATRPSIEMEYPDDCWNIRNCLDLPNSSSRNCLLNSVSRWFRSFPCYLSHRLGSMLNRCTQRWGRN